MGEFADIANERWADGDWEEDEEDSWLPTRTCRYCGVGGLQWTTVSGRWMLLSLDTLKIHTCNKYERTNFFKKP